MNKKNLKNKLLTKEQSDAVRGFIIFFLRDIFTDSGKVVPKDFMVFANSVANDIIKNAQKSLVQAAVFKCAVSKSRPVTKKVATKTKKYVRK